MKRTTSLKQLIQKKKVIIIKQPVSISRVRNRKAVEVSVIVPTFNEEKYIEHCLKHLRNQDIDVGYEIIIGDGYSTDKTIEIAKKYADKIIFEEKRTIAAGRQAAANAAVGKILVFTDADARPEMDWLRELIKPFKKERVVCVYGNTIPYDGNFFDKITSEYLLPIYYTSMNFLGFPSGAGSNLAVRREAFNKISGFNIDLVTAEDIDLQLRLKKLGKIVFNEYAPTFISLRRVKKWGYLRFFLYHALNTVIIHLLKTAQKEYEPVR